MTATAFCHKDTPRIGQTKELTDNTALKEKRCAASQPLQAQRRAKWDFFLKILRTPNGRAAQSFVKGKYTAISSNVSTTDMRWQSLHVTHLKTTQCIM